MGMTAPAIYRYFPSLDALITELVGDMFEEVREELVRARDAEPGDAPLLRLAAMARAFRRWSVGHPAEFGLLFGNPLPGVPDLTSMFGDLEAGGHRFGEAFLETFVELWHKAPFRTPPPETISEGLAETLAPYRQIHGPDLPLEVAFVYLAAWTQLYGAVAVEVFGHMTWAVSDAEPLFETQLANFAYQLRPVTTP
jgi:AcrR family transcriptional regulator